MTNLISTGEISETGISTNKNATNEKLTSGNLTSGNSISGNSVSGIPLSKISTNLIPTNVIATMEREQEYLKQVKERVQEDIKLDHKDKLTGKLRIQKKGNSVQYYHVGAENTSKRNPSSSKKRDTSESIITSELTNQSNLSNQKNQTYIPKKNITLARNLAQRDYDNKMLQEIEVRQKLVNRFLQEYPHNGLDTIYEELNDYRKNLIDSIMETDEQYAKKWLSVSYTGKAVGADIPEIFTDNGERVRSKSEKMIADKLKQLGIPYRYEAPLRLGRNCVVHPDFTVLNVRLRKEYYYEHFGMMDNPEYVENAMKRIELYEKRGIFPGDKLLLSWESLGNPLNMRRVEAMMRKFLFCNIISR